MKHFASRAFWDAYRKLPENVRELADKSFVLLKRPATSFITFEEDRALLVRARRLAVSRTRR